MNMQIVWATKAAEIVFNESSVSNFESAVAEIGTLSNQPSFMLGQILSNGRVLATVAPGNHIKFLK